MQPQIIILKEGTENSQGKAQLISNINACQVIADAVRTTLGPRGLDKMIVDGQGKATISNDGATIVRLLDVVHPAAKVIVDIAKSQDAEVGDGTTSVVLLAGEFLKQCKSFIDDGVHPQVIIKSFRKATQLAIDKINEISVKTKKDDPAEQRALLEKCASTTLSSKLVATHKEFFSKMVVNAVMMLDDLLPLNMIGIKKVQGGAIEESKLVAGVAFKKTFSYAGFEMQPKKYEHPKIALLNIELELKAERDNAEVRVNNVEEYQNVVDAEWNILYEKLEKLYQSGAKVVLSKLPIGDVATQYFADRDMFCAGRVIEEDMKRTMKACGGAILTTVKGVDDGVLGTCDVFEEHQIGGERYNLFTGCPNAKTCTFILRGGAEQFIEETERSLHDAIMIVRRAIKNDAVVAGGGAIEMELSKYLRDYSRTIAGKEQLLIGAMAKALEVIPRQLCDNAGFDATNVLNKLRQKHANNEQWYGVDINSEDIADNLSAFVWEPSVVKVNALSAACEAACVVLSVDETIKAPKSGQGQDQGMPAGGGSRRRGVGKPY
ncbi:T-complex protein 1 subunit eta [Chamberlinius hualienensis]